MYKAQFDGNHMVSTIGQGYLCYIKSIAVQKYIISLFITLYREQVTYNFEMTITIDTMIFSNDFKAGIILTATIDNYVWNKTFYNL